MASTVMNFCNLVLLYKYLNVSYLYLYCISYIKCRKDILIVWRKVYVKQVSLQISAQYHNQIQATSVVATVTTTGIFAYSSGMSDESQCFFSGAKMQIPIPAIQANVESQKSRRVTSSKILADWSQFAFPNRSNSTSRLNYKS